MTTLFWEKILAATTFRSRLLFSLLLFVLSGPELLAQVCQAPNPYRSPTTATTGKTKALVVFVQFADDRVEGDPCLDHRLWKDTRRRDRIPGYAEGLISNKDEGPFDPFSITHYFHEMSNGALTFYGDIFPRVIHSDLPTSSYHRGKKSGYGYLIKEVLEKIDGEVNFRDYDNNPCDGVIDQIIIVIRRDPAATFTGVANLFGADKVAGRPRDKLELDGVLLDWSSSGSILIHTRPGNVHPPSYMVRLLAHEYGHHLWNSNNLFRGHLAAIRNNKTPANGSDRLGYILMAGRGGGRDSGGDLLVSSYERDIIGWNEPSIADTSKVERYTLGDYYSTGDVLKVPLHSSSSGNYSLYLDNRQRVGPYDQYYRHEKRSCASYELGYLRTTGLLATLVHESRGRPRLDILAADDEMKLSNNNGDYDGDLYGSASKKQLTPFTRPALSVPSNKLVWTAIDKIEDQEGQKISFDLIPDFRDRPIIREESWITADHDSLNLTETLLVTEGATLSLDKTRVFASTISVDKQSSLIIDADSRLEVGNLLLGDRSTLFIEGELKLSGEITSSPGSQIVFMKGAVSETPEGRQVFEERSVVAF